jgi:hypothetical protein
LPAARAAGGSPATGSWRTFIAINDIGETPTIERHVPRPRMSRPRIDLVRYDVRLYRLARAKIERIATIEIF